MRPLLSFSEKADVVARQRFAAAAFPNDAKAGSRFKAKMHIPYDQRPSKGVSDSQIPHFK